MLNWVTQTWKMFPHREHGESGHLSLSCFVIIIMITLWVTIVLNSPVKRKLPHLLPRCLAMSRLNISLICWMIFFSPAICLVSTRYHVQIHSLRPGSCKDQPNLVYVCSFMPKQLFIFMVGSDSLTHDFF